MNSPKPRKLITWLLRALLTGFLLIAFLFIGSNLFLASSAGNRFLQKKLNQRTPGLQWLVSGASWSPWRGITVREVSAQLKGQKDTPQAHLPPVMYLEEVNLKPYWGQLIRGKKLFREIILEEPTLNIPLESLLIVDPTRPTPPPQKTNEQPKKPLRKPKPKTPTSKPLQTQKPKPQDSKKSPSQTKPEPPDEKRFWLRIRRAKVRLYSTTAGTSIEVKSLDTDLPLAGPDTKGKIAWQSIMVAGRPLLAAQSLPIEWKHPTWTLPNQTLPLKAPQLADPSLPPIPLSLNIGGNFAFRTPNRNFRLVASIPSQPIPDYLLHHSSRFHLRCPEFAANFAGKGALLDPNSWRFDSSLSLNQTEVFSEIRGQHLHFETARTKLQLRNATLLAPSFSIRSERLSLMGNGQLHLGGYLLAVLRIVADPELSERLTNVAIGSHLSRGWTRNWLSPLETPDRYYRDLHCEGFLPNAAVNTGKKGEFIALPDVLRLLQHFTSNEVAEEILESS